MVKAKRAKEDKFDMLAQLIKSESEEIRTDIKGDIKSESDDIRLVIKNLEEKVDLGFTGVNRRIDGIVQPQLDNHAFRIKKLETKALS